MWGTGLDTFQCQVLWFHGIWWNDKMGFCFSFAKTTLMLNTNRKVTLLILTVLRLSGTRATFSECPSCFPPPPPYVSFLEAGLWAEHCSYCRSLSMTLSILKVLMDMIMFGRDPWRRINMELEQDAMWKMAIWLYVLGNPAYHSRLLEISPL